MCRRQFGLSKLLTFGDTIFLNPEDGRTQLAVAFLLMQPHKLQQRGTAAQRR